MRIALITPDFPPEGQSGIGVATFHQALGLSRLGNEVHVYTWLDRPRQPVVFPPGVIVHRLPNLSWMNWLERQANRCIRWTRFLLKGGPRRPYSGALRNLRGAITFQIQSLSGSLNSYDIIEAPEWGGAGSVFVSKQQFGIKVTKFHGSLFSHNHTYSPHAELPKMDVRLASWVESIGINHSDVLLSPSYAMVEDIHRWLDVQQPIYLLPNSIDLDYMDTKFKTTKLEHTLIQTLKVMFVGRIDNLKGAHVLDGIVGTLREMPQSGRWSFILAGECANIKRYPELSVPDRGNVKVELLGSLSPNLLFERLKNADIFLFPSLTENCPMAVLEAMTFRLPVVASNVGGIPELIQSGVEGILCPKEDVHAFIKALLDLRDPYRRDMLGLCARAKVERTFASSVIAKKWLELITHKDQGA